MKIIINAQTVNIIVLNGQSVDTPKENNTEIKPEKNNDVEIKPSISFGEYILDKTTVTFEESLSVLAQKNSAYRERMVGKLVTRLTNSLYSGSYRIIGYDHDGSHNTFDLLTEDCVQQASSGFGSFNRHYNDSGCYARIFAEETFYNAFDSTIKEHIKPMEVKYYYSDSNNSSTGTLQTNTRYGKLLSYNEIGYGQSGPFKYSYTPSDLEGNLYPYFNNTTASLRIKKYNGSAVGWWLRSRDTYDANDVGRIGTNGSAGYNDYDGAGDYLAPVLRIG